MMKKFMTQSVICVIIISVFMMSGNIKSEKAVNYINKAKSYIMQDYDLSEIKENAVEVASFVVDKPKELYLAVVDDNETPEFSFPVDELAVSVFSENSKSDEFKYMSDETIVVHCSGSGMVSQIEEDETGKYTIDVKHNDGIVSKYIGCTKVYTEKSERVKQGQIIGEVENEGIRSLKFEIWKDGEKQNPGDYLE